MGIEIIFKLAAIGILITVICQILKKSGNDDIVALAGLVIALTLVISMISELFTSIKDIFDLY